jgi:hypothetical protein
MQINDVLRHHRFKRFLSGIRALTVAQQDVHVHQVHVDGVEPAAWDATGSHNGVPREMHSSMKAWDLVQGHHFGWCSLKPSLYCNNTTATTTATTSCLEQALSRPTTTATPTAAITTTIAEVFATRSESVTAQQQPCHWNLCTLAQSFLVPCYELYLHSQI